MQNELEQYLRETYQGYRDGYDYEVDDTPPLEFGPWIEAHGEASIRDGIFTGYLTENEAAALLEALAQRGL